MSPANTTIPTPRDLALQRGGHVNAMCHPGANDRLVRRDAENPNRRFTAQDKIDLLRLSGLARTVAEARVLVPVFIDADYRAKTHRVTHGWSLNQDFPNEADARAFAENVAKQPMGDPYCRRVSLLDLRQPPPYPTVAEWERPAERPLNELAADVNASCHPIR